MEAERLLVVVAWDILEVRRVSLPLANKTELSQRPTPTLVICSRFIGPSPGSHHIWTTARSIMLYITVVWVFYRNGICVTGQYYTTAAL